MAEAIYFTGMQDRTIYDKKYWHNVGGKDLAFWTKNSIFKYPYIMISYPYCCGVMGNPRIDDVRKELMVDDDVVIFSDSGAFTFASVGVDIDVESYARWCNRNELDYYIGTDVPISIAGGEKIDSPKAKITLEEVEKKARKTHDRTKIFLRNLDKNLKVFLALHGRSPVELELWWRIAVEPFLDRTYGIALAPHPARYMVLQLLWLMENKVPVKNLHLLGVASSFGVFAHLMARKYSNKIAWMSFDSASAYKACARAQFIIPYSSNMMTFGGRLKSRNSSKIPRIQLCECPACSHWIQRHPYELMLRPDDYESYHCLALHNVWALTKFYALCEANPNAIAILMSRKSHNFKLLWRLFKYGVKYGLEALVELYRGYEMRHLRPSEEQTTDLSKYF